MKDGQWVEVYDPNIDTDCYAGTIVLCEYEDRPIGHEQIATPIIELKLVPDLVDAAYQVAKIYYDPRIKPMEFKTAIEKLTEVLEAANYVVKET